MKCPTCGTTAAAGGRFCANCGGAFGPVHCPSCGSAPPAGAHFCNQCGNAIAGSPARQGDSGNRLAWWMVGVLLFGLILVITYPVYGPDRPGAAPPVASQLGAGAGGGAASVDLSSMTPREAADRLFNRVMTAVAADDSAEVVSFLPMAIRSFELAEPSDADGKFHLVLLRLTGQFNAEALAGALEILSEQPNHLLGLAMAGDASLALGDSVAARGYYRRWLAAYDTEAEKDLLEYQDHAPMFPAMQSTAEALAGND
jgi:predicted nucleic acid-binding Zn ribbon protein